MPLTSDLMENPALSHLVRSGEFARLCQTTKETLRHYDRIGLLKPVTTAQNGYKLYSPLQIADFFLIVALQNSGCSLHEIGEYLTDPQNASLTSVMEERVAALKSERRRLLVSQRVLESTLARWHALDEWLASDADWRIEDCPAERFVELDMSNLLGAQDEGMEDADFIDEYEAAERVLEHFYRCWETGRPVELQGTYRVGLEALLADSPESDFHVCSYAPAPVKAGEVHEKPAGRYFKMLRVDSLEELLQRDEIVFEAHHELLARLEEHGLKPSSDLYERELSLYSGNLVETIYSELSVRVE